MLTLPEFPWDAIYTTNFDLIVERAFAAVRKPLIVIKSNYDWERLEDEDGVPLFKIHGCISGDVVLGTRDRVVLTKTITKPTRNTGRASSSASGSTFSRRMSSSSDIRYLIRTFVVR
jgi:hypothetical protein